MDKSFPLTVTTPPSTLQTTPLTTPWIHDQGKLAEVEIHVPPGHAGLTGIAVYLAGVEIAPWGYGKWFILDDRVIAVPVNEAVNQNQLSVVTYNTDIFNHTFYLRAIITTQSQTLASQISSPSSPTAGGVPVSSEILISSSDVIPLSG